MSDEPAAATNAGSDDVRQVDPYAALLLASVDRPQLTLLELVTEAFLREQRWPVFEYVEGELARLGLEAEEILASLPRIESGHSPGWTYGLAVNSLLRRSPESPVILTVVGLSKAPHASGLVASFLQLLNRMAKSRAATRFSPYAISKPSVTIDRLWEPRPPLLPVTVSALVEILGREPATGDAAAREENGEYMVDLRVALLGYRDVNTIEDYVERVVGHLRPVPQPRSIQYSSPYSLPAALDYLSVAWHSIYGNRLVDPPGFERAAKLASPPETADEFDSRTSALAEVLKVLQPGKTPGVDGHALVRTEAFLLEKLPPEAHARVHDAVEVLDSVRVVRVSGQHVSPNADILTALRRLGLTYPIADWAAAWSVLSEEVIASLDAIREEIQAADARP